MLTSELAIPKILDKQEQVIYVITVVVTYVLLFRKPQFSSLPEFF